MSTFSTTKCLYRSQLNFLFFANWEDKRGWFVRFTLTRAKILGVFLAFLRNKLKWEARNILGQLLNINVVINTSYLSVLDFKIGGDNDFDEIFKDSPSKIKFFWWNINYFWTIWAVTLFLFEFKFSVSLFVFHFILH